MTRLARLIVPLVLMSPVLAQEDADELFYRAFYQETALRDFEAAVGIYEQILVPDPGNARAHLRLGACLVALGRRAEAREILERGAALNPEHAELAQALADLGQEERSSKEEELLTNVRMTLSGSRLGRNSTLVALSAYGVRALPVLEEGLRSPRAEVVDLCAEALVSLVAVGSPAADEALGQALVDPEVLLRESVVRTLYGNDIGRFWARIPEIPEVMARGMAMGAYLESAAPQRAAGPVSPEDDRILHAIAAHARSTGSAKLVNSVLDWACDRSYLDRVTERTRDEFVALAREAMDDPETIREALNAVNRYPLVLEAARERLLPYLRSIPEGEQVHAAELLLSSGLLSTKEDYIEALQLPNRRLRARAWKGYLARCQPGASLPDEILPLLPDIIADQLWVARADGNKKYSDDFDRVWGKYPFRRDDLPRIWKAYDFGTRMFPDVLDRSRKQILQRYMRGSTSPSADAARFLDALPQGHRSHYIRDLRTLDPLPLGEFARKLTASKVASDRGQGYALLARSLLAGDRAALSARPPHLIEDMQGGPYWEAGELIRVRANPEDILALRQAVDGDLSGQASDEFDADRVIALTILLTSPEECLDLLNRRFRAEDYVGREALLVSRAVEMLKVFDGFRSEHPDHFAGSWARLAAAVHQSDTLTQQLYREVDLEVLAPEEALELIRHGLQPGRLTNVKGLERILREAGTRDLGVDPALLLPFVRHQNYVVRKAAVGALDMLQRYQSYRRAAATFGGDAKLRAIERIRTNITSPDSRLRIATAHAIAALGDPEGVILLLDLAEDEDDFVRHAAVQALIRMGGVSAGDEDEK